MPPGGRGRGPAGVAQERGPKETGVRKRKAPGAHCRRWPPQRRAAARMARSRARAPGRRLRSPPAPPRYCPGPAARQPREGRAAPRSLLPRRSRNVGLRSLPCSRLRHDPRRAASRAAAASSGRRRRRHVFLPCTWPCHRGQWLRSAPSASIVQSRRAPAPGTTATTARETPNALGHRSASGCWKSLSLSRCHRLFRLPH